MAKISYSQKDYEKHLKEEHKQTVFSDYLREIVFGGNDGIVTTFAVVAGFTGAQNSAGGTVFGSTLTVLLFGLANLFADGTSMGLGNFLSLRSEQDVYKSEKEKELYEIKNSPGMEKAETFHILRAKGFTKAQAIKLTDIYSKNSEYWTEFMMRDELNKANPLGENPIFTGLVTFLSFVFFGFIPLFPYIIFSNPSNPFLLSISFTAIALVLLGILRWRVTKEKMLRSISEVVLIGGTSAVIAYVVGTFFRS